MLALRSLWSVAIGLALSLVASAQVAVNGAPSSAAGQATGAQELAPAPHSTALGIWSLANSPYLLEQDLVVLHLVIEAGVEVLAAPGVEIIVLGELIARGDPTAPIYFHNASGQGKWNGLRFSNTNGSSALYSCRIEGSRSSGIEIENSAVFLRDCEISNNSTPTYGGGISASINNGDLVLEDCHVLANTAVLGGGGINAQISNGEFVLDGCTVEGNSVQVGSFQYATAEGGGVRCKDSLALYITGSTIRGNSVHVDSQWGAVAEGGGVWVRNTPLAVDLSVVESNSVSCVCAIMYCITYSFGGGIYVDSDDKTFEASTCLIAGNQAGGTAAGGGVYGAGLYFKGREQGAEMFLTNCVIARNRAIDGSWYSLGGVKGFSAVEVSYVFSNAPNPGGNSRIQNTIATENTACYVKCGSLTGACTFITPLSALLYSSTTSLQVDYNIFADSTINGIGNPDFEPEFTGSGTQLQDFGLSASSPGIDAGNPAPALNDVSFPPSQGGLRNDMGIFGGPLAGSWSMLPTKP